METIGAACSAYVDAIVAETDGLMDLTVMSWALMNNPGFPPGELITAVAKTNPRLGVSWDNFMSFAGVLSHIRKVLPEGFKASDLPDPLVWTGNLELCRKVVREVVDSLLTSESSGSEYYFFLSEILWPGMFPVDFYTAHIGVQRIYKERRLNHRFKDRILTCYPSFRANEVHIIGCGGTGARLVPLVAQFMGLHYPEQTLHLWDMDIVEPKNLDRQLFVQADIGKYKASALEKRYKVLHKRIVAHNREFVGSTARAIHNYSVVMMAVDTMEARRLIIRTMGALPGYNSSKNLLVIDGGNTDTWGQVATFTVMPKLRDFLEGSRPLFEDQRLGLSDLGFGPVPCSLYTGPVATSGVSCGGMEQSMAINSLVASGMFASFQNWHFETPLISSVVYYGLDGMVRFPMTINEVLKDTGEWLERAAELE